MSATNLSFVLKEQNSFHFEDRKLPIIEDENDVLLKVLNVGICGSDVHYWSNGRIGDFVVKSPIILGHETSAVVIKCGSKVTKLKEGDRVAIEPGVPCRRCTLCVSGRYNLCSKVVFHATPPVDGTLCQYITHPEDFCFKLPDNVSNEEGALLEPLSVGVHACRRGNVTLGSKVLIIGAGTIGLVNLLVAQSLGADDIIIVDINERRLEVAKQLGANYTIQITKDSSNEYIISKIKEHINGLVDKTIECSGAPNAMNLAIEATISGGCVVIVGMGPPVVQAPLLSALIREVDIRGVFRYANCYSAALSLISQKRINMERITLNGSSQSLTSGGFRFTAPPTQPELEWFCTDCWWTSRDQFWQAQHQERTQTEAVEQLRWCQQQLIQSTAREQTLRRQLLNTEERLQQVERRVRRRTQTRNCLALLSQRLGRLERHLGVPAVQQRMTTPLTIDVDLDSPLSTADQGN